MSETHTVMLVDLSSIGHQIYHISASEIDPDYTSKTVVNRIHALAQGCERVAICCDSGPSFRKDISADYKANRPERDAILMHQMDIIREQLAADGFPVWSADGFEADDILASGAKWAHDHGYDVMVVSGDKDLMQLVVDRELSVKLKSIQTGHVFGGPAVVEKFGVLPEQMRDWISLVGDTSDNIKGAKGIGAKGAATLLKRFGSLDNLYRDWDEGGAGPLKLTPALAVSLAEFRERLPVVRALVTLRTDVPLDFDTLFTERVPPPMASDDTAATVDDITYAMGADGSGPLVPQTEREAVVVAPVVIPAPAPAPAPTVEAIRVHASPQAPTQLARVPPVIDAEVVPYERRLDPQNMQEAITLAKDMFTARNFAGASSPQTALATIMMGREMGIGPLTALRTINVIEGRHCMSAQLIVGMALKSGLVDYVDPVEISATSVTYAAKRKGRPEVRLTHTIEMAQQAGLVKPKSGWEKNPTDMLVSRCSSRICRIVAPDVCATLYTPDEVAEMKESHNG